MANFKDKNDTNVFLSNLAAEKYRQEVQARVDNSIIKVQNLKQELINKYKEIESGTDTLTNKQQKQLLDEIKKRRKASKLPTYLIKKMFYYKDSFGKPRAYEVQKMVSRSLQMDIQKSYSRALAEVAAGNNLPESPEGLAQANKIVQSRQEDRRKEIYEVLLKTQKQHLRKSRF